MRAGLAQEYVKVSREQAKVCESHIHDQHLQHQVSGGESYEDSDKCIVLLRAGLLLWLI